MAEAAEAPQWFACRIERAELKRLMKRNDHVAALWLTGHLALLAALGAGAWFTLGTWWSVPAFLAYGVVHSFLESPVHEMHHGTPFRSRRLNEALHTVLSHAIMKEPVYDRWAHTHHHSYTALDGDAEIELPRPASIAQLLRNFVAWDFMTTHPVIAVKHAFGIIGPHARSIVPESEHRRMIWSSRAFVAIYGAIIAWSVIGWTIVPLLYTILPRFYGRGLGMYFVGLTQHAGMADNVLDHRRNTRTFISNPVVRFLYWNMNYHVEHHMFPQVPFHALPKLHAAVRDQMPPPYAGVIACWREMIPAFLRQQRDPTFVVQRPIPQPA
jgi:fatty acid desaturase